MPDATETYFAPPVKKACQPYRARRLPGNSVMRRLGPRCAPTYFEYAPGAPQPTRRLTKSEFATARGLGSLTRRPAGLPVLLRGKLRPGAAIGLHRGGDGLIKPRHSILRTAPVPTQAPELYP